MPKQGERGPAVGQYLLVAIVNRSIAPRSKARAGAWHETTVLPRLVRLRRFVAHDQALLGEYGPSRRQGNRPDRAGT